MAKKAATETSDATTLKLIEEVNRQKKEIASAEKPQFITNCNFSYSENGANIINIHVESKIDVLVRVISYLLNLEEKYNEAAKLVGVESPPPFTWQGFTVKDWASDVRMRLTKVQITAKKKKLEALEERLNKLISPELRAKMELEAIAAELG